MSVALHPSRPEAANASAPSLPASIEAEQAVLGAILYDNQAYERLPDGLKSEHFYEPFHGRLFAAIEAKMRAGELAEPVGLTDKLQADPGLEELGGIRYLADMVDRAPPVPNARDFAEIVIENARRRDLIRIGADMIAAAEKPQDGETSREIIEAAEGALYGLGEPASATQGFQNAETYLAAAVNLAAQAYQRDGGLAGISTGLIDLDQKTGGLHSSDVVIIAARPSMGKSALAVNIGLHSARAYAYQAEPDGTRKTVRGGVVGFFSLEMSAEQLGLRMLSEVSGISGDRIRKGQIDPSEFGLIRDAALELRELPFFVDATGGITLAKLAARARRLKRTVGLDLLIIDYLQLIQPSNPRAGSNRVEQVTEITVGLKALAKELNVPVVALSQLSRQVESRDDKRPQLADLRESGSIEQDADMVMFIFREEYYLKRKEPKPDTAEHLAWSEQLSACQGVAEIIIGKQRHGPIGTVRLSFNEDLTKFGNLARESLFAARKPYGDD